MKAFVSWDGDVWNSLMWLAAVVALVCVLVPFVCDALDTCQKIKDQLDRNGHAAVVAVSLDDRPFWT